MSRTSWLAREKWTRRKKDGNMSSPMDPPAQFQLESEDTYTASTFGISRLADKQTSHPPN